MMDLPAPEELLPQILDIGEQYEFDSFVIGVHFPETMPALEKSRLTRPLKERLGRLLERQYWPGRTVDFDRPELQLHVEAATGRVQVITAPVFVAGRYRKYSRTISSTHWQHMGCGGRGCPACGFKGYLAEGSVGEIVGRPLLRAAGGSSYTFHGMGREDVDARMLGTGRPFVVEIAHPRRRRLDLPSLREEINQCGKGRAGVAGPLAAVAGDVVATVKGAEAEKSYCAVVVTANPLPRDAQDRVASLTGERIGQYTPSRVRHRRAGKIRYRDVAVSFATILDSRSLVWQVRAGAGTYIKELASGDGGSTTPSLTERLETPAVVLYLDVVAVHARPPWEDCHPSV